MYKIIVDVREDVLIPKFKDITIQQLEIGDIMITCEDVPITVFERKTLDDLAASIRDGRYEEQSARLKTLPIHPRNIFYIIEGNIDNYTPSKYTKHTITKDTLYSAMFSIQYYKGFSLIRTQNPEETAHTIEIIQQKLTREHGKRVPAETISEPVLTIKKKKQENITPENIDMIFLSQIPSISATIASALVEKYKTIFTIKDDIKSIHEFTYMTSTGKPRHLSKTNIQNLEKFLHCATNDTILLSSPQNE
jgi:ERCC4-type nuclease